MLQNLRLIKSTPHYEPNGRSFHSYLQDLMTLWSLRHVCHTQLMKLPSLHFLHYNNMQLVYKH